jgi:hypothetical protein
VESHLKPAHSREGVELYINIIILPSKSMWQFWASETLQYSCCTKFSMVIFLDDLRLLSDPSPSLLYFGVVHYRCGVGDGVTFSNLSGARKYKITPVLSDLTGEIYYSTSRYIYSVRKRDLTRASDHLEYSHTKFSFLLL